MDLSRVFAGFQILGDTPGAHDEKTEPGTFEFKSLIVDFAQARASLRVRILFGALQTEFQSVLSGI